MLQEDTIHKKAVLEFLTKLSTDGPPPKSRAYRLRSEIFDEIIGSFQEEFDFWPEEIEHLESGRFTDLETLTENRLGKFRRDGSSTSKEAANEVSVRSGTQRFRVLEAVILYGATGATRDQLANYLSMTPNSVRPRVKELLEGGFIRAQRSASGNDMLRMSNNNRPSIVLEATPKGIAAWDKEKNA